MARSAARSGDEFQPNIGILVPMCYLRPSRRAGPRFQSAGRATHRGHEKIDLVRKNDCAMKIYVEKTPIPDLLLVRHQSADDDRGSFVEAYRRDIFADAGLPCDFSQVNQSLSRKNVVRGLHMQWQPPMGKLMSVLAGRGFLVAVDIRRNSLTFGRWFGVELTCRDRTQVWAPAGFARGFCALEDDTWIQYFCTGIYNPAGEGAIRWDDPGIGIDWPVSEPIVSRKDAAAPSLAEWLKTEGAASLASRSDVAAE